MATTVSDTPNFTPVWGGNGLEAAEEGEGVEDTYFRLITETTYFRRLHKVDSARFLIELASLCLAFSSVCLEPER